jgi:predicted glycoside hydrolase/deacetylase ChbG (UPF0249 family)
MKRKLIITADDYGMCEAVNHAIEECLAASALRATCIMMNMPTYSAAASLRQTFTEASLGIHWTLTEGCPVLPPSQVPTLVNSDGSFFSATELRRRWLRRQIKVAELKAELRTQYKRFCEVAGMPDFWNTHQNFHVLPGMFATCVALGRELHIPSMRCHRRFTIPRDYSLMSYNFRHPTYYVKGWGIGWWSRRAERQGMLMPDGLVHMPGYETAMNSIEHAINRLPWHTINKAVELVIHPATTSNNKFFRLNAERRVQEYHVFKDPKLLHRLQQINVETVGFEAL